MPYITQGRRGGPPQPGFFGGCSAARAIPLFVLRDPNAPDFAMPELGLPADMSGPPPRCHASDFWTNSRDGARRIAPRSEMDGFQGQAPSICSARRPRNRRFRSTASRLAVRERYGRNIYGQSVLLARRLIEAGTRVACISWAPDANATWDTHGSNFVKLKNELLPQLDAALSSLLTDLADRGLLERTLVAVMGEFGRTPKVNGNAGRDHWNFCYSLLLAGGGLQSGLVHGASDHIGALASCNPVTPADIVATIYTCLGIDPNLELTDRLGRPFALVPWGTPIRELLA